MASLRGKFKTRSHFPASNEVTSQRGRAHRLTAHPPASCRGQVGGQHATRGKVSMRVRLKRLEDQVIVITGGASGIGLAAARRAAARGARVVVTSRDQEDIDDAVVEIERHGGRARPVVADVTVPSQVEEVARLAVHTYDRIDTWVNNAGVSFVGRLMEAPLEDMRRVFEVNFWG